MILLISIALIAAFHIVLLYAVMTKRFNVLYYITAVFAFMAPVSTASALEQVGLFKYGRVYLSVLAVVVGMVFLRLMRFGPASIAFIAFIMYYFSGALWGPETLQGILYKGLFAAVFLSGVIVANGTNNLIDLKVGLRTLAIGGAAFAVFIMMELVRNPDAISAIGRLYAFGINPNRIGHTSAPMLIIATCLALHDSSKAWRMFGYGLMGALALIILYTGSRGAVGMALIGSSIVAAPIVKRPGLFLTSVVFVAVIAYIGFGLIEEHARTRLAEIPAHIRETVWGMAMEYFREAPVFGQGWVHTPTIFPSTQNMHSIYMQVLAELGLVGIFLFVVTLAFVGIKILSAWRYAIQFPAAKPYAFVMIGFFAAIFAHGVVESATFVGTTVNAVLLGWAIGMIDRLPELAWEHEAAEVPVDEVEYDELAEEGDEYALPVY